MSAAPRSNDMASRLLTALCCLVLAACGSSGGGTAEIPAAYAVPVDQSAPDRFDFCPPVSAAAELFEVASSEVEAGRTEFDGPGSGYNACYYLTFAGPFAVLNSAQIQIRYEFNDSLAFYDSLREDLGDGVVQGKLANGTKASCRQLGPIPYMVEVTSTSPDYQDDQDRLCDLAWRSRVLFDG